MTGRIVRTELRRSAALWAGICALGVALAFLYSVYGRGPMWDTGVAWTEQWSTFAMWSRFLLVLVLPVVAGAGALLGMRDHRAAMTELLATTPRPAAGRAAVTAGALAIAVVGGYLVLFVVGGVQIVGNGGPFFVRAVPVAVVGLVALVAAGLLGMGLGRVLPSAMTPPLVAGVGLIVLVSLFVATNGGQKERGSVVPAWLRLLSPVENDVRNPWLTITNAVSFGQLAWLLGLATAGFVLIAATAWRVRLAAVVPALVGLGVAVAVFPTRAVDAYAVDPVAAGYVCAGDVCVTRLHEQHLATVSGPAESALRKLSRLPNAPTRIEEPVGDAQTYDFLPARSATTIYLPVDYWVLNVAPHEVEERLLRGAGTPTCIDPQAPPIEADAPRRELAARHIAGVWLAGGTDPEAITIAYGRDEFLAILRPAWESFTKLSTDEQRDRVGALRAAGLACDGRDMLAILADGTEAGR